VSRWDGGNLNVIRKVPDVGFSLAPASGDHEKYILYNYFDSLHFIIPS
jgi:hypothetical protein